MAHNVDVCLRVTIPICGFRKGYAREYLETEVVPPPATVYGFLLSMVGEEDRYRYRGTRIAYALFTEPAVSTVLRTVWRVKKKSVSLGSGVNRTPARQELLTGLDFGIWVASGELATRINKTGSSPEGIVRFGGLCLGESRDLVNDIHWSPKMQGASCRWLKRDPEGDLPLPIWVDHVGSQGTVWEQFRLIDGVAEAPTVDSELWITINGGSSN